MDITIELSTIIIIILVSMILGIIMGIQLVHPR